MEINDLEKKRLRLAKILVITASLIGCSIILFKIDAQTYKNPFAAILVGFYVISLPVAYWSAYLLVLVARLVFKSFLSEKHTYIIFLAILVPFGFLIGFLAFLCISEILSGHWLFR